MLMPALKRIFSVVLTMLAVSFIVFLAMRLIPGSRSQLVMGDAVSQSSYSMIQEENLDYFQWLVRTLRLDFGKSAFGSQSVSSLILERTGASLILALLSLLVAFFIAWGLSCFFVICSNRVTKAVYECLTLLGMSLPSFVLSLLLVIVFSVTLGWLPSGGYVSPDEDFALFLRSMILPVTACALLHCGLFIRMMVSSMERELAKPYSRQLLAKGLSRSAIVRVHSMKNVRGEVFTLLAQSFISLFCSTAAVENIFSIPGLGSLTVSAIARRDVNTLSALVTLGAFVSLIATTFADIVCSADDRRLRKR